MNAVHHSTAFSRCSPSHTVLDQHSGAGWSYHDFLGSESPQRYGDHEDCQSQSLFDDGLRSVQLDNERWRHEQKHLQPLQPAHEFSMIIDSDEMDSPWTVDDPTLYSGGHAMNDGGMFEDTEPYSEYTEPNFVPCAECGKRFDSYQQLERHGKLTKHLPFACSEPMCDKRLARRDTMQRHMDLHKEPQYSCRWCKENGVSRPFTRKDHWKRHESKYCPHRPANADHPMRRPSCQALHNNARLQWHEDDKKKHCITSTTPTVSLSDAERKRKSIKQLMGQGLHPSKYQTVERHLNTMDEAEMQGLYERLATTVLENTSCARPLVA